MTGLYLFGAAVGVPLIAWFLLTGGDDGGGDEGVGAVMLRFLPVSTIAIVAATFGVCGLLLGAVGTTSGTTFVAAVATAVGAGMLNRTVFAYLRRSESGVAVGDDQLGGAIGRVVLPLARDHRGRIHISVGGQQLYLSAQALIDDEAIEVGAAVLVVEVRNGVARVTRLDPELA